MTDDTQSHLQGFAAISSPRSMRGILSVRDLEAWARSILPKAIFSYASGGVEDDRAATGNEAAFRAFAMKTNILVDSTSRDQSITLFGEKYRTPFGIAPMGAVGLAHFNGDLALAQAAHETGQIYVLSASSTVPLEQIAQANPRAWFQTYLLQDRAELDAIVNRAADAGIKTLVVTVDIPVPANRENNIRNGYDMPLKLTPQLVYDGLTHPKWLAGVYLRSTLGPNKIHFENQGTERIPFFSRTPSITVRRDNLTWKDLSYLRSKWQGSLVVKGVLSAADALRAREAGSDGIVVSNHGGRQLDIAIPPLQALPDIVAAVPGMTVLLDSGIRRGTDILIAQALGAQAVLMGRPYYYAVTIGGREGASHFSRLLANEVDRGMATCGVCGPAGLKDLLYRKAP